MYLYIIQNSVNDKVYIGITTRCVKARFRSHKVANTIIGRAIRKYGADKFTVVTLGSFSSLEELWDAERVAIEEYDCVSPKGYNKVPGGINPAQVPSVRAIIKSKAKGRKSPRGKDHHMWGTKMSDSTKGAIKEGRERHLERKRAAGFKTKQQQRKEYKTTAEYLQEKERRIEQGRIRAAEKKRGAVVSETTRKRLSAALTGKPKSPEHVEKVRKALTGKTLPPEVRAKISQTKTLGPVICVETGATYASAQEASDSLGIAKCNILRVMSGKRKTAGGYTFTLAQEESHEYN